LLSLSFFSPTYQMDFISLLPLILASLTVISGNDPERITVVIEEPFFAGFHY